MHFLPDTEDVDAAAESYWPDSFKQVIQKEVGQAARAQLDERSLLYGYHEQNQKRYPELEQFIDRIVTMVVIGAENGADIGFDAIYRAFLAESPLPEIHHYAHYFWPQIFTPDLRQKIHQAVVYDYSQDDAFEYAYKDGYAEAFSNFSEFIDEVGRLMVIAVMKGFDNMLGRIYRSFVSKLDLPPARRNPKRLKSW